MKTVFIKDKKIKLYDSIDEMPIVNFQKYNKCVLIDSGLGSDVDSIDSHIVNIAKYINKGDKKNAMQELQNMRQNMHMVVSNVSPKNLAFAVSFATRLTGDFRDRTCTSKISAMLGTQGKATICSIFI